MEYPVLKPCKDGTFILYKTYRVYGFTIPKGFKTDGLTLKIRVLRIFVDKYQPKFAPFFTLHDYLCSLERYKEADWIGSRILLKIENSWRTKMMIKAIKIYHKFKYRL